VATWLDEAGYETAYLGKYMNGYDDTTYVPPGWDEWFGWLGNYYSPAGEYRLNNNGRIETYNRLQIHDTDLLRKKAVSFLENRAGDDEPFFMWLATNAPHVLGQPVAESAIVQRGGRFRQAQVAQEE
jgi:N-acetylglucosamine-6-sulfatase